MSATTAAASAATPTSTLLADLAHLLQTDFTRPVVLWQFAAILATIALAALLTAPVKHWFDRKAATYPSSGLGNHLKKGLCIIARNISFSLVAALLLSGFVFVIETSPLQAGFSDLVFARLAYSVYYSWAILLILLSFLSATLGENILAPSTRRIIETGFWIFAVLQILGILPEIIDLLRDIPIPIGKGSISVWDGLVGIFTVFITVCVANWLSNLADAAIMNAKEIEINLRVVFTRITRVALIILAVLIALSTCGIDLTILSVFGGALGVGLGFGMQKITSNYVSGFIILFDRSVKIGDLVEINQFAGKITQINTRYSVIKNTVGEELIVPNENFVTQTVKNYSLTDRAAAFSCEVGIAYNSNVTKALDILLRCAQEQSRVLQSPSAYVTVSSLADSCIQLKVSFWVADPENGTAVLRSNIMRLALDRFAQAGIEIPYPQNDVHLTGTLQIQKANASIASRNAS